MIPLGRRLTVSWLLLASLLGWRGAARAETAQGSDSAAALPPASPEYVQTLQELLAEGFESGPRRLQAAQKKRDAARQLSNADWRADYAFGLVLVKQGQIKQAAGLFESVAERAGGSYWPAWQACIWTLLVDRQYDKGLPRLEEFARIVGKTSDAAEPTELQRNAARWIGQIFESLDRTVTAAKLREKIDTHETRVREALGESLAVDYDLGGEMVDVRHFAIRQEAGIAGEQAEKKQMRRRQQQSTKLRKDLDDLDKQKEGTAKSAEEWKAWLDETLTAADKQLGQLEKEYLRLQDRARSLEQSILLVSREITVLDLEINTMPSDRGRVNQQRQFQLQQQILQRQNQLINYQSEYNASTARMAQTAQQGQIAMRQRAGIVEKYEKATGDLVKKNAEIERWSARVANKQKRVDAQPIAKSKGSSAAADRRSISLKTLLPLDLESEKTQLLELCGVKPPAVFVIDDEK